MFKDTDDYFQKILTDYLEKNKLILLNEEEVEKGFKIKLNEYLKEKELKLYNEKKIELELSNHLRKNGLITIEQKKYETIQEILKKSINCITDINFNSSDEFLNKYFN